jgi:hypothetical protein
MTARASTTVEADAGMVYAEGMRNGIRTAISLLCKAGLEVPRPLRAELTKWDAHSIHREWLAQQGRPVPFAQSEQSYSFIHLALQSVGLECAHVD